MLVSRHSDTEQSHWSFTKFETTYQKPTSSPRMSNHFDTPLSTQPDWQGQYSYLPPSENNIFSQPFESGNDSAEASQTRPAPSGNAGSQVELNGKEESSSSLDHRRTLDPLGLRSAKPPTPTPEHTEAQQPGQYAPKTESAPEGSLVSSEAPGLPLGPISSTGQAPDAKAVQPNSAEHPALKDEDEEILDDEDMTGGMGGDGGDHTGQPQTAAERTAQRRKMKRFRLTHQQTRFLMSEFAKQPHPDAAHRERLSREIPGLSPRQVQVWFQNRRAKIKRLTADDRDRMMKMRAVPDDFDNVGALHSPYGAVHGLATPISSPVDFTTPSYTDHMMRGGPLMVDVRRAEGDDHMSPTGLSPAFGNIGFSPSGSMNNSDILSPLSPTSNDRYGYPLSAGARTSNPYQRHNSLDTSMQMQNRPGIRPLQPLHLRETMSRSRSDNLQSPLRSSMSWKGDSIDYNSYQNQHNSPQLGNQNRYPQDQMGGTSTSMGYESTYSTSTVQSPTAMNYPNMQQSGLQSNSQSRNSRLRAASATLPLGLDLRNQYRPVTSTLQSPGPSSTPRANSSSQYGSSNYTASFPSAPLTAPVDFSMSRNSGGMRSGVQDYSMPQLSAPIAPPNDFSQAFQASMTSPTSRTPMRESFGGGPLGISHGHSSQGQESRAGEGYGNEDLGSGSLGRKRSFTTGGGSVPTTGAGPQHVYGSTN